MNQQAFSHDFYESLDVICGNTCNKMIFVPRPNVCTYIFINMECDFPEPMLRPQKYYQLKTVKNYILSLTA